MFFEAIRLLWNNNSILVFIVDSNEHGNAVKYLLCGTYIWYYTLRNAGETSPYI